MRRWLWLGLAAAWAGCGLGDSDDSTNAAGGDGGANVALDCPNCRSCVADSDCAPNEQCVAGRAGEFVSKVCAPRASSTGDARDAGTADATTDGNNGVGISGSDAGDATTDGNNGVSVSGSDAGDANNGVGVSGGDGGDAAADGGNPTAQRRRILARVTVEKAWMRAAVTLNGTVAWPGTESKAPIPYVAFPGTYLDGTSYNVTATAGVEAGPVCGVRCTVSNGSGTVNGRDVEVDVTCNLIPVMAPVDDFANRYEDLATFVRGGSDLSVQITRMIKLPTSVGQWSNHTRTWCAQTDERIILPPTLGRTFTPWVKRAATTGQSVILLTETETATGSRFLRLVRADPNGALVGPPTDLGQLGSDYRDFDVDEMGNVVVAWTTPALDYVYRIFRADGTSTTEQTFSAHGDTIRCVGGFHASLHIDGAKGVLSCQRNTSPPIAFRRFSVRSGWVDPSNVPVPGSSGGFDQGDSHWVHYAYNDLVVVSWDRRDWWIFSAFDGSNVDRTLSIPPPHVPRYPTTTPSWTNPTVFNNIHVRHLDNFQCTTVCSNSRRADTRRVFGPIRVGPGANSYGDHAYEYALNVARDTAEPAEQASLQLRMEGPSSFSTCIFNREPVITNPGPQGGCRYESAYYVRLKDTD